MRARARALPYTPADTQSHTHTLRENGERVGRKGKGGAGGGEAVATAARAGSGGGGERGKGKGERGLRRQSYKAGCEWYCYIRVSPFMEDCKQLFLSGHSLYQFRILLEQNIHLHAA